MVARNLGDENGTYELVAGSVTGGPVGLVAGGAYGVLHGFAYGLHHQALSAIRAHIAAATA